MKLKIEMESPAELDEFRNFVFDNNDDLVFNEVYEQTASFNKEPIVVAVIIALGGPIILKTVQSLIKEYFEYKKKKEEEETKRHDISTKSKDKQIELSINSGIGWKKITTDEFESVSLE